MKQDVGFFDVGGACPDIVIENGDLKAENGLESAALISLFTNRRVSEEEKPENEPDRMGWWADALTDNDLIGSILWTVIDRGKTDTASLNRGEDAIRDGLQWMIDDGIAKSLEVSSARLSNERILFSVNILRPDGDDIPFKAIWDAQSQKIVGGANV